MTKMTEDLRLMSDEELFQYFVDEARYYGFEQCYMIRIGSMLISDDDTKRLRDKFFSAVRGT